jgi:histidine ammonia-lyase
MTTHYIGPQRLTFDILKQIIESGARIELSETAKHQIVKCRQYLDDKIKQQQDPVYGVNTGFGSLCNHIISPEDLHTLQKNLVMSHACGTGQEVPHEIVRIMLLLKIQSLSYGHSAIALKTVERLVDFFNHDIIPVVYDQGSLGASGDLSPLAHLCLPLLGLGEVYFDGQKLPAAEVLNNKGWEQLELESKEGLPCLTEPSSWHLMAAGACYRQKNYRFGLTWWGHCLWKLMMAVLNLFSTRCIVSGIIQDRSKLPNVLEKYFKAAS